MPSFAFPRVRFCLHWTTRIGLALFVVASSTSSAHSQRDRSSSVERPKLQFHRWNGEINVPDPVAISVANNGDVYVTQTQRRKIQDLDIRAHRHWIPDDVGLSSVEEKQSFLRKSLPIQGDQTQSRLDVEDVNEDGSHDWRDLTVISEKIHRLVDSDGDGTADSINLFAEDFKTEVTGIAAGVMHWNGSVWATIAPDVWKLTDTNGDGSADSREVIATGFGIHIAYAGHDMHGLAIGPDGKIYWSIGDKGISVTSREGKRFHFPNQGGVMRCNPDGSDFEVFAHGLRNVQEIAFDQYGNLFGVDNDADMPGERERFVWIVDQMDAGWRCNYQYRGDDYNPWTAEKLWQVAGPQHPAYLVPPIQNYIDGPAGFKFNPGGALAESYRNYFFLTGAPNGNQYAFRTEPDGDSFSMMDEHQIGEGDPIVGIAFGPDGGLYGVDWGGGYPLNQSGGVIRIDIPDERLTDQDRKHRQSTASWLNKDLDSLATDEIVELLGHIDQRVRLRAQFALVNRKASDALFKVLSDQSAEQLSRIHAIWGIGQLNRAGEVDASTMYKYLRDSDPIIRNVVVKTLGEKHDISTAKLIPLLGDDNLHVQVHTALAIARHPTSAAAPALLKLAENLQPNQHYLRHAVVTALAECLTADHLAAQANSPDQMTRMCCALALRRQSSPSVAVYLNDPSPWIATEAARAIHDDFSIEPALPNLAESLDQDRSLPNAMAIRAINANYRTGSRQSAERVLRFLADAERETAMRIQACQAIGDWFTPPLLDRVDGRRRMLTAPEQLKRELDTASVSDVLAELVKQPNATLRVAAVKAARNLKLTLPADALLTLLRAPQAKVDLRREALLSLVAEDSPLSISDQRSLLQKYAADDQAAIAVLAIEVLTERFAEDALPIALQYLNSKSIAVRQASIYALVQLTAPAADKALVNLGQLFIDGQLDPSIKLDVYQALEQRAVESATTSNVLNQIESLSRFSDFDSAAHRKFSLAMDGGDPEKGELIFRTDLRAQCSRCHKIGKRGSEIGPDLTRIAQQRDAAHLLRAVVYPSADIDPKYNAQTFLLADGEIVQGVIQSQDDETTVLVNSEGKSLEIETDEIEAVSKAKVSLMPDMTKVLSANEVRDLVAFLKTLR